MNTEILQKQLTQFGLNPQDWVLHKMKKNLFKIHSHSDDDFCFVGKTIEKEKTLAWDYLQLVAI